MLGAGSTSGWAACTPGGFRARWKRRRLERVLEEEEEVGWGSQCPGAGCWHGYAGVARLGEDTHA